MAKFKKIGVSQNPGPRCLLCNRVFSSHAQLRDHENNAVRVCYPYTPNNEHESFRAMESAMLGEE